MPFSELIVHLRLFALLYGAACFAAMIVAYLGVWVVIIACMAGNMKKKVRREA